MSQDQCSIKHSLGNAGLIGPGTLPFHSEITFCACSVPELCPFFTTPWTVAHQPPLSMEFFRQEYWSGLPFFPPRDLLDPGIKPASPVSPALASRFFTTVPPGNPEITLGRQTSGRRPLPQKTTVVECTGHWLQRQSNLGPYCGSVLSP